MSLVFICALFYSDPLVYAGSSLVPFRIMEYDEDKVDEMVLALLSLTMFEEKGGARAWKGHAWDDLDRLHAKVISRIQRAKPNLLSLAKKA
jgi:hypothetical protein